MSAQLETQRPVEQNGSQQGADQQSSAAANDPLIERDSLRGPLRPVAGGVWQPRVLPPNDLSDPPEQYRNSRGGACLGMSAVVYGLWCSRIVDQELSLEQTADLLLHNMLPGRDQRYTNYSLPARVRINGQARRLSDTATLVRLAEFIQQKTMPGGALKRSPQKVRQLFQFLSQHRGRLTTEAALRRYLEASGGRALAGLLNFTDNATRYEGHAAILMLDKRGRLLVWDPNADMSRGPAGSGQLAEVTVQNTPAGRISSLSYAIILPDGSPQRRQFSHVFEIAPLVESATLPE
ncbi:MAG: hypothetical protein KDA79_11475 [Planctomycetaceae bacterium]|nr:hypothetical protein [Planctomycetaceae bacterium]